MHTSNTLIMAALASFAMARTDLSGCTSTDVSSPAGASLAWYVPGTGEICEILDCGGGRAPPKTTVPGCAAYKGTSTYSPSYLPGFGSATAAVTSSVEATTVGAVITESTAEAYSSSFSSKSSSEASAYPSSTSLSTSLAEITTSTLSSMSTSTITSAPVAPVPGNGTVSSPTGVNGTVTSGSPSSTPTFDSGAVEAARVFVGGAGLLALGAVVALL